MERLCKALTLGEFTFKRKWDHFWQLMDPIWQQEGTPKLHICTHVQYIFYKHEGQLRLCKTQDSVFLFRSLHLQYVSEAWSSRHCVWLICFHIHLNFFTLFPPLSPISRRLVDIRGACSFSHWPLQHTVNGGFLSRGYELDTVTSFPLVFKGMWHLWAALWILLISLHKYLKQFHWIHQEYKEHSMFCTLICSSKTSPCQSLLQFTTDFMIMLSCDLIIFIIQDLRSLQVKVYTWNKNIYVYIPYIYTFIMRINLGKNCWER